jgi:tRNA(fMet)-specific endonuclease VapC
MDKELICIDTSILIDYFRKKNKNKTLFVSLSRKYRFAISVITKFEILTGSNPEQSGFWNLLFKQITILPLLEKDIELASAIFKKLTSQNKIIGLKDILIASTALANDLKLSTLNLKDFERIEELMIIKD